ncbi:Pc24g01190 [Penicillium rubens Wisconsin 54-1255]|uniref:Pc24g01190 protein n=1 Tax=Penicillium rubens (strain ATCC 28089 / DSM 1075 / NRRL 1951 / Wisconsin 54-1255) TaxID=500485 RepID=B6HWF6_PENRW|nr:Pc24g01190 [Penicillium rubens Wisconsin 54-1255]
MGIKPTPGCSDIGPEFDRLKADRAIYLDAKLVAFVEKAHSSLQSRGRFKQRDCYKRSLLHYAAMGNCTNLLLYLLQSKPDVDSRDQWGRTALSWAAQYGSLAVANILLEQGANLNASDYEGGTPLTWLIHAGNPEMVDIAATEAYLRERGAKEVKLRGIKWAWMNVITGAAGKHCGERDKKQASLFEHNEYADMYFISKNPSLAWRSRAVDMAKGLSDVWEQDKTTH